MDPQEQPAELARVRAGIDLSLPLAFLDARREEFMDGVEGLQGPVGDRWIVPRQLSGALGEKAASAP